MLPKAEEARPRRIQIRGGEQPRQIGGQGRGLKGKASHSMVVARSQRKLKAE
jgi:hypothetical protein